MAAFFSNLTKQFETFVLGGPVIHDPGNNCISNTVPNDQGGNAPHQSILYDRGDNSTVNPNSPDFSTSTYEEVGRDFRFTPENAGPMRPNFIPVGTNRYDGRYYPTGTSCPTYTVGVFKQLETIGTVKKQVTLGRWQAMCDNCFEDRAEGFWEKTCQIDMQTKQTALSTWFKGRCNLCGRLFHENVPGI